MDRRTKILAGLFGAFIAYAVLGNVVYPRWIEPILTIDERIAERQAYLAELQKKEDEVWEAKREYRCYLDRIGSLDKSKVENTLRERINALVESRKLEDVGTTWGSVRARTDKKTGITSMTIVVSAAGTLQGAVESLKDLAELPNLAQLGNVKITPDRGGRGSRSTDRVDIRVPLEVWVLSVPRIMEKRFEDEDLNQPDSYVRHEGRSYASIWEKTPLTPYGLPIANAGADLTVEVGERTTLKGEAREGDGRYTFKWIGEGLDHDTAPSPTVDTSQPLTRTYTLTVTDGRGRSATDSVVVTVREKRVAEKPDAPPISPERGGPARWKDGRNKQLRMVLSRREGEARIDEAMVYDVREKKSQYLGPGDEFDGGELVYVHPTGALVRREDEYFVYPIGAKLNQDVPVDEAMDYPRLREVADWIRDSASRAEPGAEEPAGEGAAAQEGSEPAGTLPPTERPEVGGVTTAGQTPDKGAKGEATGGRSREPIGDKAKSSKGAKQRTSPDGVARKTGKGDQDKKPKVRTVHAPGKRGKKKTTRLGGGGSGNRAKQRPEESNKPKKPPEDR